MRAKYTPSADAMLWVAVSAASDSDRFDPAAHHRRDNVVVRCDSAFNPKVTDSSLCASPPRANVSVEGLLS